MPDGHRCPLGEAKTLQMLNPVTNARSARWLRPAALKGVWMIPARNAPQRPYSALERPYSARRPAAMPLQEAKQVFEGSRFIGNAMAVNQSASTHIIHSG